MAEEPDTSTQGRSQAVALHSTTYDLFILFLTIYSLVVMVLLLVPWLNEATRTTLLFIDTIVCIIFLGDFLSNLHRSESKRQYFLKGGGWLDLMGCIPAIPIFRLARQVIVEAVSRVTGVLPDLPEDALYVEMGQSAIVLRARWWIESYADTRRIFVRVHTEVHKALTEAGIRIPFSTFDLHLSFDPKQIDPSSRET